MKNNTDAIGIVLAIVVISAYISNGSFPFKSKRPLLPAFNMESLIKDFHKMTDAMGKVDNLGQLALSSSGPADFAKSIAAPSLPDLGNIADTIAPLLKNFDNFQRTI